MNVEETLAKIAKKTGEDVKMLKEQYEEVLANTPPGAQQEYKALQVVNKRFGGGKSPAIAIEGIVLSVGSLFDYNKNKIATQLQAYADDSESALSEGKVKIVDGEAVALDMLKTFSTGNENKNFGLELKNSYNRNCVILVKDNDGYASATLALRNKLATDNLPPLNTLLKFRVLGNLQEGFRSSDSATKYETVEVIANDKLNELIMNAFTDRIKMLGDCMDYHKSLTEKTPEFYNRMVITSGTAVYVKPSTDTSKNHFAILDDPTVEDSVSCFIDNNIPCPDQGSDITVIAQTVLGKKWDTEKKEQTDEEALQLNVSGIIPS